MITHWLEAWKPESYGVREEDRHQGEGISLVQVEHQAVREHVQLTRTRFLRVIALQTRRLGGKVQVGDGQDHRREEPHAACVGLCIDGELNGWEELNPKTATSTPMTVDFGRGTTAS